MGLTEAKSYIKSLHRKQDDPYVWPDYLTGLPEKAAIISKLDEVYPKLGTFSVACVRVANVHPYLIKYGPSRHAELIEWAAAILKTTADSHRGFFVGALSTHDFVCIGRKKAMGPFLKEAVSLFKRKSSSFYSDSDRKRGHVFSFTRDGEKVHVGLMGLVSAVLDEKGTVNKDRLIHHLGDACKQMELSAG